MEFSFLFVEKQKDFAENLREVVSARSWPMNIKWEIQPGSFEDMVGGFLEGVKRQGQILPRSKGFFSRAFGRGK